MSDEEAETFLCCLNKEEEERQSVSLHTGEGEKLLKVGVVR